MSVKHNVNARGIDNHIQGTVGRSIFVYAQMGQGNHIIGSLRPCFVHSLLYRVIKLRPIFSLTKTIQKIVIFIHKKFRCRSSYYLWCANPHIGYRNAVIFFNNIGVYNGTFCFQLHKIAGYVLCPRHLIGNIENLFHPVIKFMIAKGTDIVPKFIHKLHHTHPLREGSNRFSLYGIAAVHQRHIFRKVPGPLLGSRKPSHA